MAKVSKLSTTDVFKHLKNDNMIELSDKQLKELQKVILSIADDVIGLCEKNNISYHLTGGSALGAVRHKGFIPWDDDIDIDVSRKDYDRLINLINENYSDKYYIHNWNSDKSHCIPSTQIRLKGTVVKGINDYSNSECGAYLDIAVIENTYNNKLLRKVHGFFCMLLGFIVSCRKFFYARDFYKALAGDNKEVKKVFGKKIRIGFFFSFLTLRAWTRIYNSFNKMCKNEKSKYVVVPTGRKHFFGELYEREDFAESTYGEFEGRKWKIPKNYKKYLTYMYKDYMKLPKEKDKEKHVLLEFDI